MKNTLIAVGLLGLSFWFYTESQKKGPDLSHEIPALDISDGTGQVQQFASGAIDNVKSKLGGLKGLEFPDLSAQKQKASELAANLGNDIKQKAAQLGGHVDQLKNQANQFKNQMTDQVSTQLQKANDLSNELLEPKMPTLEAPQTGRDFEMPRVNRQALPNQLDSAARDEGLINALKEQNNWQNQPNNSSDNSFLTNPTNSGAMSSPQPSSNQFASVAQPGSVADSSYNTLASDESAKLGSSNISFAGGSNAKLPIQSAWTQVEQLVAAEKFKSALRVLSQYYRDPDLPGPQRQRLMAWLDALAGKVIFSDENHIEPAPYTVGNESLTDISLRWKVPAQLIYNINQKRIANPANVAAGTQLKILEGPFRAEVDMSEKVLTVFLGDLYAGRFPVEIGISGNPKPGDCQVMVKSAQGHAWMDENGNQYPPGSPMNGYGPNWIGLTNQLCIHQISSDTKANHNGCIGVKGTDAKDVFAILGKNSQVKLIR